MAGAGLTLEIVRGLSPTSARPRHRVTASGAIADLTFSRHTRCIFEGCSPYAQSTWLTNGCLLLIRLVVRVNTPCVEALAVQRSVGVPPREDGRSVRGIMHRSEIKVEEARQRR